VKEKLGIKENGRREGWKDGQVGLVVRLFISTALDHGGLNPFGANHEMTPTHPSYDG
jgi:hypothetical protein